MGCPMVDVAMRADKKIEEEMLAIVNTNYGSGNLVLLGGIGLNMPYKMGDCSLPLGFSIPSQGRGPVRPDGCFNQGSFTVHAHRGVFLEAKPSPWRCSAFVSAPSPWLRSTFVSTPSPWRRSTFVPTEMKAGG